MDQNCGVLIWVSNRTHYYLLVNVGLYVKCDSDQLDKLAHRRLDGPQTVHVLAIIVPVVEAAVGRYVAVVLVEERLIAALERSANGCGWTMGNN